MFDFIGAAVSAVGSAIGGACSAIGGAIGSTIIGLDKIISVVEMKTENIIETVCKIVVAIGEALGLIDKTEKVEELGAKATQVDTKKPEDFETSEEYIKYLREEVELDKDRLDKMSKEEKHACQLAGTAIIVKGVEEKTGTKMSPEFLVDIAKIDLNHRELSSYIDAFKANGVNDMKVMTDYLSGKCEVNKVDTAAKAVVEGIMSLNPDMSKKEVDDKLGQMMQKINS
ncbi:MAG: hypothetical protein ACRCW1_02025 [Anaerotignaceae bacterium]